MKSLSHRNSPQIDIHILVNQHLEENTSMMERNQQEVAVLQVKTKYRSTKVSSQHYHEIDKVFYTKTQKFIIKFYLLQNHSVTQLLSLCIKLEKIFSVSKA